MVVKSPFFYLLTLCLWQLLVAEDKEASLKKHDWYQPAAKYIEWDEPIHFLRVLPVPASKIKDTESRLKDEAFFSINEDEAKWFLNDPDFSASSILGQVITSYTKESQQEIKNAVMLRQTNSTTEALVAEHKALKYKRKVDTLKKITFNTRLFLVRGLVSADNRIDAKKFNFYLNNDNSAMCINYVDDDAENDKVKTQPVVVILKEALNELYVTVTQKKSAE